MTISIEALNLLQKIYELSISEIAPTTKAVFIERLNSDIKNYDLINQYLDELYNDKLILYKHNDRNLLMNFDIKNIITSKGLSAIGIEDIDIYETRKKYDNLIDQLNLYKNNIELIKIKIDNIDSAPVKALLKSVVSVTPSIQNIINNISMDDMNFLNENKDFINEELELYKKINSNLNSINLKNIDRDKLKEIYTLLHSEKNIIQEYNVESMLSEHKKFKSENNKTNSTNTETLILNGILGKLCGHVIEADNNSEKRIQEKGFYVKDGIKVLRGFAKASDLAKFSKPDSNYQRKEVEDHLNSIKFFMDNIRTSAKYLSEVTLVTRGYEELIPIKLSGSLSTKQKGELDNLDYYQLKINKEQLYRIDGNHRLLALEDTDYYISFAIIIWKDLDVSIDDEAFLFYFLNSKARRLTTEENLKGLVEAETWTDYELKSANTLLPYLRYFKKNFEENKLFNNNYYKDSIGQTNAKIQMLKVLKIILDETDDKILPFDNETFDDYILKTQEILSQRDRFKYLREKFRSFPQFIFYTLYKKNGDLEESIKFINETNAWAEYYKHDSNSFMYPDKMYNNAYNQLTKKINIFVAMPFYNEDIVQKFNVTMKSIIEEIKNEEPLLSDKLNLYEIMTYKMESTDILANMDQQISDCDIFIADISKHDKTKVNPNVMFELGRVFDKKKFLLIRDANNKDSDCAFDIHQFDYIKINYGMSFDASMQQKLKPRIINIAKSIIGIC